MSPVKKKPSLKGKRIVITRSEEQSSPLREKIEALGGEVLELPLIEIVPHEEKKALEDVFAEISNYYWIVFTSANGVKQFFESFFKKFEDIRCIGGARFACIGESTAAELKKVHLHPDIIPEESVAESLAEALIKSETIENEKILVVIGNLNRDILVKKLEEEGRAIVDTLQVYETKKTKLSDLKSADTFRKKGADAIVFASSSTVKFFVEQAGVLQLTKGAKHPKTCSIGPITSKTMREMGLPLDMEAKSQSMEGIVTVLTQNL